jgi:hypothetical protein
LKTQFDHIILSSFYLWFESELLSARSSAYISDLPNQFKAITAKDIPAGYIAYQGGYRQLVAESSIDSPNSGFYVNNSFVSANASGFNVDYENGRIIVPAASGSSLAITGLCATKEVNTYISNDDEEQLILHGDFREVGQTTPYFYQQDDKLDEKTYFLPACFISLADSDNKPFSFGGEEDTQTRIRVAILTKDNYLIDGILSYFRDSARKCVYHVPYEDYPYGKFNSLKSYPYSYAALKASLGDSPTRSTIEKVIASKITNPDLRKNLGKEFQIGFLDFDLSTYRFPRL